MLPAGFSPFGVGSEGDQGFVGNAFESNAVVVSGSDAGVPIRRREHEEAGLLRIGCAKQ